MCLSNGTALDPSPLPDYGDIMPIDCGENLYNTLEDIDAAMNGNSAEPNCLNQYMVGVLQKNLKGSLDRYNDIMANHYDNGFNASVDAVVQNAPKQVNDFMLAHGKDYFTCAVTELSTCCVDSC
jgi:hypothetical protein